MDWNHLKRDAEGHCRRPLGGGRDPGQANEIKGKVIIGQSLVKYLLTAGRAPYAWYFVSLTSIKLQHFTF